MDAVAWEDPEHAGFVLEAQVARVGSNQAVVAGDAVQFEGVPAFLSI